MKSGFQPIYERLAAIMKQHEGGSFKGGPYGKRPDSYQLVGPPSKLTHGRPAWFGAVVMGKAYVSYHLIPVYMYPDLLKGVSPQLRQHMQGKSCFNFKTADDTLFAELETLTRQSFARFQTASL